MIPRFTCRVAPGERVADALLRRFDDEMVRALATHNDVRLADLLAFAESRTTCTAKGD